MQQQQRNSLSIVEYDKRRLYDVSVLMARAFSDDPAFSWLVCHLGSSAARFEALRELMETLARAIYAPHGESYLGLPEGAAVEKKEDRLKGIFLLHPPLVKESFIDHMRQGIHRLPIVTGFKGTCKVVASLLRTTIIKDAIMADSQDRGYWYVGFLAVDPDYQGQGVGCLLLQLVLDKADRDDLPIYLETSNPKNVPWYERFGFVVVYKEKAGLVGPTVFYLRREAKSSDSLARQKLLDKAKKRVAESNHSFKRNLAIYGLITLSALFFFLYYYYF